MKEFNLARAIAGDPVTHRNGKIPRKIVGVFDEIRRHQKLLVIDWEGEANTYSVNGRFYESGNKSHFDLFMAPIKKELWKNIYCDKNTELYWFCTGQYVSEEDAKNHVPIDAKAEFIKSVLIREWEE